MYKYQSAFGYKLCHKRIKENSPDFESSFFLVECHGMFRVVVTRVREEGKGGEEGATKTSKKNKNEGKSKMSI
jgi:hypothetical protein